MALTKKQARDQYIIDSFAQFLDRNVKTAYDAEVAPTSGSGTDISKPLLIMQGKPSDAAVALSPPSIGIEQVNSGSAVSFPDIGTNTGWRTMILSLYCYPAVEAGTGAPSDQAASLLQSYMRDVLQTVSFKVLDYSNVLFAPNNILYCVEHVYIRRFTAPMNRGKNMPNAAERNRFDISVHLEYPVDEVLVS